MNPQTKYPENPTAIYCSCNLNKHESRAAPTHQTQRVNIRTFVSWTPTEHEYKEKGTSCRYVTAPNPQNTTAKCRVTATVSRCIHENGFRWVNMCPLAAENLGCTHCVPWKFCKLLCKRARVFYLFWMSMFFHVMGKTTGLHCSPLMLAVSCATSKPQLNRRAT